MIRVEIDLKLPSLNDYVNVCRSNPYKASKYKRNIEHDIGLFIKDLPRFDKPVRIKFEWVEINKRRDLDNIAFAKKFILDSMVKYGKLEDDSQKYVKGFTDTFSYGDRNKIILEIEEADNG